MTHLLRELKAASILLFPIILRIAWGSAGWLFYWSHLESVRQLPSDGGYGWTSEVASSLFFTSVFLMWPLSPAGQHGALMGELRAPRGRKQKPLVFLRPGLRGPRMFLMLHSFGQSQGQGQSIFYEEQCEHMGREDVIGSHLCKLPTYNLCPLPLSSVFSFSLFTVENFELPLLTLFNT